MRGRWLPGHSDARRGLGSSAGIGSSVGQPPKASTGGAAVTTHRFSRRRSGGNPIAVVSCRVVTRVRIPASQVWEGMKGLENQLSQYEAENPDRKPPTPTD
jgi:hypothetical protein